MASSAANGSALSSQDGALQLVPKSAHTHDPAERVSPHAKQVTQSSDATTMSGSTSGNRSEAAFRHTRSHTITWAPRPTGTNNTGASVGLGRRPAGGDGACRRPPPDD